MVNTIRFAMVVKRKCSWTNNWMLAEHAEKALIALLLFATWQMLRARSIVIYDLTKATFLLILCENIGREALILADEARQYQGLAASPDFGGHD